MDSPTHAHIERYLKIVTAVAAGVLVVLCIFLIRDYRHVRRLNYIAAHGSLLQAIRARGPIQASDASLVATWMTFDYINHLFALPPQYLATQLNITDNRYPRLTVAEYAEDQHAGQSAFLAQVQNALRAYFAQKQ